jgi:uncharacterized protein YjbI with pentapeptide repeats
MRGAQLKRANLDFADLAGARLARSNLTAARLNRADLTNATLSNATLEYASASFANFTGAQMTAARLEGADFTGANFLNANLANACLVRTNLCLARFNRANLSGADCSGADLRSASFYDGVQLHKTNFRDADLTGADFLEATLNTAILSGARLDSANLRLANLEGMFLSKTGLAAASFSETNLRKADLRGADLSEAALVRTKLQGARLTGARVYGAATWDVDIDEKTDQRGLVITFYDEPVVTVDDLQVAQFIHLLLHNPNIRAVIDTITSKVVLILGRFTPERRVVLDELRAQLRKRGYSPVLFDFPPSANRNLTETVSTLAHMARFIIPDLTDPKSVPQELMHIVPQLPSVPVQPVLLGTQRAWSMFVDLLDWPWVLPPYYYRNKTELLRQLPTHVIGPAEAKAEEQIGRRGRRHTGPRRRSSRD